MCMCLKNHYNVCLMLIHDNNLVLVDTGSITSNTFEKSWWEKSFLHDPTFIQELLSRARC